MSSTSQQKNFKRFLFPLTLRGQGVSSSASPQNQDQSPLSDLSLYLVEGSELVIEGLSSSGGGDAGDDATASSSSSCLHVSSSQTTVRFCRSSRLKNVLVEA